MRLRPFSILQVCMGNICRSPMAERLLVCAARELVEALGKPPGLGRNLVGVDIAAGSWDGVARTYR